jgi:hypothetical protein
LQLAVPQGDPLDILLSFRNKLNVVFFMNILILMARNDFIFRGQQPVIQAAKERFKSEFALVIHRAKQSLKQHVIRVRNIIVTEMIFFLTFFVS